MTKDKSERYAAGPSAYRGADQPTSDAHSTQVRPINELDSMRLRPSSAGRRQGLTGEETLSRSTTASQLAASVDRPRSWRQRPLHRRRASQPVSNALHLRANIDVDPDNFNEESSSLSGSSDDDATIYSFKSSDRLDYLDLSISVPYALVSLRDTLLAYSNQLEERFKAVYSGTSQAADMKRSNSNIGTVFYSHLDAIKEDLRSLAQALPSPSMSLPTPTAPAKRASKAIVAKSQSLANDWERFSQAFHTKLAIRPDFPVTLPKQAHDRAKAFANDLSILSQSSPFADVSFSALWAPLASALPSPQTSILITLQERFETLQEAVRAMTLRDLLFTANEQQKQRIEGRDTDETEIERPGFLRSRSQSFAASQQALAKQVESIIETVKTKGHEAQQAGRKRANSFARAAREAEEHIYAKAVELARNGQRLINYEHLPELWKNNEHILSGYRFIPKEEWTSLLKSTFQIHNETGNIMTHLVGAFIVAPLFWPSGDRYDEKTTPMDRMVQSIYLIAALKCLLLSVSWHVMAGCSDALLFERFACVDYTGIAWLVAASVWTLVYNAFYCQPNLAMVYSLSTLVVGLVGAIVPWAAWFNDRRNKPIRIAVFLAMCFTGLAPFTHAILSHGVYKTVGFFGAILPSCMMYVFGLIFYATQFPECLYPGRFDVVGHAHQIWHISIVVAILLHHRATFFWHENRFNFSCSVSMPETTPFIRNPLANDLNMADEMVHGWRIIAGRLGDGLVGRVWDRGVEAIMSTF